MFYIFCFTVHNNLRNLNTGQVLLRILRGIQNAIICQYWAHAKFLPIGQIQFFFNRSIFKFSKGNKMVLTSKFNYKPHQISLPLQKSSGKCRTYNASNPFFSIYKIFIDFDVKANNVGRHQEKEVQKIFQKHGQAKALKSLLIRVCPLGTLEGSPQYRPRDSIF